MRVQIGRPAVYRTFTLTRTVLHLRMDKYEPHKFCQFNNEQSRAGVIKQNSIGPLRHSAS